MNSSGTSLRQNPLFDTACTLFASKNVIIHTAEPGNGGAFTATVGVADVMRSVGAQVTLVYLGTEVSDIQSLTKLNVPTVGEYKLQAFQTEAEILTYVAEQSPLLFISHTGDSPVAINEKQAAVCIRMWPGQMVSADLIHRYYSFQVHSPLIGAAVEEDWGVKTKTVYPAAQSIFFEEPPVPSSERDDSIVMVSRFDNSMDDDKNQLLGIELFLEGKSKGNISQSTQLILIGGVNNPANEAYLAQCRERSKGRDDVVFLPNCSRSILVRHVRYASLFLHLKGIDNPIGSALMKREHFGLVMADAYSAGTPAIIPASSGAGFAVLEYGSDLTQYLAFSSQAIVPIIEKHFRLSHADRDKLISEARRFALTTFHPDVYALDFLADAISAVLQKRESSKASVVLPTDVISVANDPVSEEMPEAIIRLKQDFEQQARVNAQTLTELNPVLGQKPLYYLSRAGVALEEGGVGLLLKRMISPGSPETPRDFAMNRLAERSVERTQKVSEKVAPQSMRERRRGKIMEVERLGIYVGQSQYSIRLLKRALTPLGFSLVHALGKWRSKR